MYCGASREPGKNNSAHFTGNDLIVVCANSPFTYSFAVSDSDDDKLRYTFCDAYQSGTSGGGMNSAPPIPPHFQLVLYGVGFAGDTPLRGKVAIDAETGLVGGVAPDPGIYVNTVCVEEIRDGVVIASQRKDIQLNITGCTIAAALLAPDYQLCGETNQLTFENLSASPLIQAYAWRIMNRQGAIVATSNTHQFTHSFCDTGLYSTCLNTNIGLPCTDSTSSEVRYYAGFKADFTFMGQYFGSSTNFTDNFFTKYGSITGRSRQLGEHQNADSNSQAANPGITYASQGFITASLLIENSNGCTTIFSKQLSISAEPPLEFAFRDTLICPPDTLQLRAFGEGIFTWSPAPKLLSGASTSAPMVAPLQTTWFRVIQVLTIVLAPILYRFLF